MSAPAQSHPLDDESIERYARQIIIPGIGAAGQKKLCTSTVVVVGHPRGCRQAGLYLEAAGVEVRREAATIDTADIIVVADAGSLDDELRQKLESSPARLCWYELDETGFTAGIHPDQPLPPKRPVPSGESVAAMHDPAACDAAAAACALILGLPLATGGLRLPA